MKLIFLFSIFFGSFYLIAEDTKAPAKPACDPKKSVCEDANPEMYKKFEAYQNALDKKFEAYRQVRGENLKAAGWKEIARCDDGHTWAYVLEKSGDYLKCEGINALGGPEEHPCVPFDGDLDKFNKVASSARAYTDEYDRAKKANKLEKFLAKKMKDDSTPHCW